MTRVDPVLAAVAGLSAQDVSDARVSSLRARCHAALRPVVTTDASDAVAVIWARRRLGPALAGAWCVIYVFETIRRAIAFYRF